MSKDLKIQVMSSDIDKLSIPFNMPIRLIR